MRRRTADQGGPPTTLGPLLLVEAWFRSTYGSRPTPTKCATCGCGGDDVQALRQLAEALVAQADAIEAWNTKYVTALTAWSERHHRGRRNHHENLG